MVTKYNSQTQRTTLKCVYCTNLFFVCLYSIYIVADCYFYCRLLVVSSKSREILGIEARLQMSSKNIKIETYGREFIFYAKRNNKLLVVNFIVFYLFLHCSFFFKFFIIAVFATLWFVCCYLCHSSPWNIIWRLLRYCFTICYVIVHELTKYSGLGHTTIHYIMI